MATSVLIWLEQKSQLFVPPAYRCYMWNMEIIGFTASERMSFEKVDRRRTTMDGQRMPAYTISSPMSFRLKWANNSGSLNQAMYRHRQHRQYIHHCCENLMRAQSQKHAESQSKREQIDKPRRDGPKHIIKYQPTGKQIYVRPGRQLVRDPIRRRAIKQQSIVNNHDWIKDYPCSLFHNFPIKRSFVTITIFWIGQKNMIFW